MNTRIKTTLVIVITLVIGMIIGALIHGAVMRNRYRQIAFRMRTNEGFMRRMERVIQPDESQRKALRAVLEKHFQRMSEFGAGFQSMMDSLKNELDLILTEEQRERLERGPLGRGGRRFDRPFGGKPRGRRNHPFMRPDSTTK